MKRFWAVAGAACLASLGIVLGPTAARAAAFPGFDDQASLFHLFYDCQVVSGSRCG